MDKVVRTGLERVLVTIHSAGGVHRFDVEVARTLDQQALGLMHRRSLGKNRGMIFPMNPPRYASFWMHETLIPLDIIFIRADGRIERITAARPRNDSPVLSGEPVAAVLEIRGGRAEELGIRAGDRVEWPR
ncbi:MAG TPA: DUF192 domain-containing protein [Sphingomicrobium sp.]